MDESLEEIAIAIVNEAICIAFEKFPDDPVKREMIYAHIVEQLEDPKPRCVVGRCLSPNDRVQRCFYNDLDPLEAAFLDLCSYHQSVFGVKFLTVPTTYWKPKKGVENTPAQYL